MWFVDKLGLRVHMTKKNLVTFYTMHQLSVPKLLRNSECFSFLVAVAADMFEFSRGPPMRDRAPPDAEKNAKGGVYSSF